MDYLTISMNRNEAISFGQMFRKEFGYDECSPFNPIEALERVNSIFPQASVEVVEDNELAPNVHADIRIDEENHFMIRIKETVYIGAHKRNVGGYRMDITHEIVHLFLYLKGYKPVDKKLVFENNILRAYESVEWQAKAVAGEVMIPYEATIDMGIDEIIQKYHVSRAAAEYRSRIQLSK